MISLCYQGTNLPVGLKKKTHRTLGLLELKTYNKEFATFFEQKKI